MKTLVIETSSDQSLLALLSDQKILFSQFLAGGPALSKTLALDLANLLASHPGPYDRIALGIGPGSYTGTRVGAALAQSLCFGWRVPLYTAPSLTAFGPNTIVDARQGGFYVQLAPSAPKKLSLEEAEKLHGSFTSPHPDLIGKRLPHLHVTFAQPDPLLLIKASRQASASDPALLYL